MIKNKNTRNPTLDYIYNEHKLLLLFNHDLQFGSIIYNNLIKDQLIFALIELANYKKINLDNLINTLRNVQFH